MNNYENNITIIIPVRKIDFLLKECIAKIRELYPVVKINIIIDSFEENEISNFDKNILFIQSKNKNMSAKRNLGVEKSQTEYVAFIDSDAYPDKNWIENACEFLSKNQHYAAVTGNQILPPDDNIERQCLRQVRFCKLFTYSQWCKVIDLNVTEQDCEEFMTSNLFMKKETYDILQGMNENIYLAEDNDFSKKVILNGYKIRFIPNVRVFHHEASYFYFMKKIFAMADYYTKNLKENTNIMSPKEIISMFFPIFVIIIMFLIFLFTYYLKINIFYNFIIPFVIAIIFTIEAINLSKRINYNKIKLFFMFLFYFISFCIFYLTGQISGFLRIRVIKTSELYRQY